MTSAITDGHDAWWRHLTGRPFYWVLDGSHPAADLLMLTAVVERPVGSPGVARADLALREWEPVEASIAGLAHEQESLHLLWRLRQLAEFGLSGDDERIATAVDRLLDDPALALVPQRAKPGPAGLLDAVLLSIPLAFGYSDDERVVRRLQALTNAVQTAQWPYPLDERATWLTQALWALSLAPPTLSEVEASRVAAGTALEEIPPQDLPAHWHQLGTPAGDQPDVLAAAFALARCTLTVALAAPWVTALEALQQPDGGWRLERQGPAPVHPEPVGQPSR